MERFDGWDTELYHHGIKGQKWGVRRFQNEDGTLTSLGRAHYGLSEHASNSDARQTGRLLNSLDRQRARRQLKFDQRQNALNKSFNKVLERGIDPNSGDLSRKDKRLTEKMKKNALKAGKAATKLNETNSITRSVLADAVEKGYTIKSKNVTRYVATGKTVASDILFSAAGAVLGSLTGVGLGKVSAYDTAGTKYKVRNDYR